MFAALKLSVQHATCALIALVWLGPAHQCLAEPIWHDAESATPAKLIEPLIVQGSAPVQGVSLDIESADMSLEAEPNDLSWFLGDTKPVPDIAILEAAGRQPLQEALLREAALFRDQELLRKERDAQLITQRQLAVEAGPTAPADQARIVRWDIDRSEERRLAALLQFLKENRVLLLCSALWVWMAFRWRSMRTAAALRTLSGLKRRRIRKRIKVRFRRQIGSRRHPPGSENMAVRMPRS